MDVKTIIPLLFVFITLHGLANEPITFIPVVLGSQETVILNDTVKPPPAKIHGNLFVATPTFFSYNFNQESVYYTPALMGGFEFSYNKIFLDLAAFVGKEDSYGATADLIYSFRVKPLDENWVTASCILGEAAWFPAQQGIPDMTAYTIGLVQSLIRPYSWGMIGMGFMLGGAYMEGDVSLNLRVMVNVSLPVF